MQVAGTICKSCSEKIAISGDGTWCRSCQTTLHTACINDGDACPGCGSAWAPPEKGFHYSESCPVCARANEPSVKNCRHCGNTCYWDNRDSYIQRRDQINAWGGRQVILGLLMVVGPILAAIPFFGAATIIAILLMVPAGVMKTRTGLRAKNFR